MRKVMGKFLLSGQKTEYLTVKCGIQASPNVNGEFELNDGNHRHKAYENLGIEKAWVIFWITEEEEFQDFMKKYSEYAGDCVVIRK